MKDRKIFICLVLLISSVLFSCKWQIPEKVSVKTNAEYNFSAGNINMSLDDKLDVRKMMGDSLPANVKMYDYFPGKANADVQRYLIKASLVEIPLDIGSMMDKIDLNSNLQAMEFSKDIVIPAITIPEIKKTIDGLPYSGTIPMGPVDLSPVNVKADLNDLLPASSGVGELVIGAGKLGVKINGFNDDAKITVGISSTGGLSVNGSASNGSFIPLNEAIIRSGTSQLDVTITLENIKSVNSPEIVITPEIKKVSSVAVSLGEGVPTSFKKTAALPTEATSMIESIQLNNSGFDMVYTNTLPASNEIKFTAKSNFLGLDKSNVKLEYGTDKKITATSNALVKFTDHPNGVDFEVGLVLPGGTSTPDGKTTEITIKDVELGKTYKLGFKITPKLDWTSVSVKPDALNSLSYTDQKIDLGLDLNTMLGDVGEKLGNRDLLTGLSIDSLPIYVFCGKPQGISAFDNLSFSAKAKLTATEKKTDGSAGTVKDLGYLIGDAAKDAEIKPVNSLPDYNIDNVVTDDFGTKYAGQKATDLGPAFSKVISTPGSLGLTYSVSAKGASGTSIKITKAELEKAGVAKIALEAYIDLGLALKVPENGITIDLSNMEGIKDMVGKDIFQGNGKSMKDQGYDAYMKAIKELSINAGVKSLPYASANPITMNMTSTVGEWNFELGAGKNFNVNLTNENITKLFEDPVKNPNCEFKIKTMDVVLPGGTFSVPRAKNIDTSLELKLVTDGTIKVWEKGQTPPQGSNSNPSSNGGN